MLNILPGVVPIGAVATTLTNIPFENNTNEFFDARKVAPNTIEIT